ncbi:MAG TPA: LysR family transcriptional regulator [Solirubrobacterales bacterium]|nr:LysR family transcriptional regulator [Solirubrobacterales bacterium]
MRIEQLEYVTAVARLGSFRHAAQELHVSQPALSEAVRKLEIELGVAILERGRTGASISTEGREILPYVYEVIESVDNLRHAADDRHRNRRVVRLGTTAAATAPLLTRTIGQFSALHPATEIEVITARQRQIHRDLIDGNLDLGLVNYLLGDDMPPDLESTELLRGKPVVCMRVDSPLAKRRKLAPEDLVTEPLIAMRSGYLMHRYAHRLLDGHPARFTYAADGAEMGKLMVAEGLGIAILPDYSVHGDPLEQSGAITVRRIDDDTEVIMVIQRRPLKSAARAAQELHQMFLERAGELMAAA